MTTEQLIYSTARSDGMPDVLAQLIVAQSKGETGNYTSSFFTVGNNAFGYSYDPGSKWQLDKGGPNADNGIPIAQYASVQDSVHELTDWIKRRQAQGIFPADLSTITTPDQYASLLKKGSYYGATESSYANLISVFFTQVKNMVLKYKTPILIIVSAALFIGAGVFIYLKTKKKAA